ncbi:MAG: hypothetical protein LBP59_18885 [Planctomycetaceae bacterium]|nr:hypothetical protein [Planctomycetaceae bacterium]
MSDFLISSAFLFAFRQNAGGTPAIRWSRLLFRIAGGTGGAIFLFTKFFLFHLSCEFLVNNIVDFIFFEIMSFFNLECGIIFNKNCTIQLNFYFEFIFGNLILT